MQPFNQYLRYQNSIDQIMKSHELEQQERIEYDQLLYEGRYIEAAKLAFENNYTQLFINTVNNFFNQMTSDNNV